MPKSYLKQFEEALACRTKEGAEVWMCREIVRYKRDHGKGAVEAKNIILHNIGYMAGYYDRATAKKIGRLFGAGHPIFGGVDYHSKEV